MCRTFPGAAVVAADIGGGGAEAATGHGHHSNAVGYSHGGVGYGGGGGDGGEGGGSGTVRIFCKADPNFSLAVKYNNTLVLTPTDAREVEQHWYKVERFSRNRKDEEGFPCFSLINKATNLAMKHAKGDKQHVQLVPYNPNTYDESILWSMSKDFGDGYRAMRMVNNIRLNVDALNGDKQSGGVHDGTNIVLWEWNQGDNQLWKIQSYCKLLNK
ncbi:ricin B-like lectin R40C1 [Pistacia vera]|uniref:ricin B-like lectin R40C1 n=1 Tax=Pistacia vera TaxID=55513 RepID=UPI0012630644|nr:ricin B-like lectin R40C1 [Pistacia vera]